MAMVSAVLVSMVAVILSISAAQFSLHELNTTGVDRKEVQTTGAAQAGLDLAIADLQSATPPCTVSGTLASAPTTESYAVTITYYNSSGTSLNNNCSGGVLPASTVPSYADVSSVGQSSASTTYGSRTMQAEVTMSAVSTPAVTDAIFSNGGMTSSSTWSVSGQPGQGNDATVYTNGNYNCTASGTLAGTVYAQGSITTGSGCTFSGAAYAKNNVDLGYSSGGSATAYSADSSEGNISVGSHASVTNDAFAHGTITNSGTIGHSYPGSSIPDPPEQSFPVINFIQADWQNAGYTNFVTDNNCSNLVSDIQAMSTATAATVINTTCALSISTKQTFTLAQNLAIFASGGVTISGSDTFQSNSSTARNLYLMVPYSVGTTSCQQSGSTADAISVGSGLNWGSDVDGFIYTPCNISWGSASTITGQIYAGGYLTQSAHLNITYDPGDWPGATGTGGAGTASYTVNIVYEREKQ